MSDVIEKFGIVVLLDALGVQGASIQESIHFVNSLKQHENSALEFLHGFASSDANVISEHYEKVNPISRTFGDTFLLTWELPQKPETLAFIEAVSSSVAYIIHEGIENGVLFRGAISIGKYLESETTIIGPAITDAASWHEHANWFGCITTPNCTQHINAGTIGGYEPFALLNYSVPFKVRSNIDLWCVDWPRISFDTLANDNPLKWYYDSISKLSIPMGTEDKYINSEQFIKYSISNK